MWYISWGLWSNMSPIYAKPFQALYHLTTQEGDDSDYSHFIDKRLRLREGKNSASPAVAKLVAIYHQRQAHLYSLTSESQLKMSTLIWSYAEIYYGNPKVAHQSRHECWALLASEGIVFEFLSFFLVTHMACGILVPWLGIEPMPPAVEAQSLNHWTILEVSFIVSFDT